MWNEADPRVTCCIQSALSPFRHEILLDNLAGIPVMQQHGSADDNVPVFHSRRLHQLINQGTGAKSNPYYELEGKGHWYNGVMTTPHLKKFFEDILQDPRLPPLPSEFCIVICNTAEMGPRGGLQVDHLVRPDQAGKIEVSRDISSSTWRLCTSNVLSFHFVCGQFVDYFPSLLFIDGQKMEALPTERLTSQQFQLNRDGGWDVSHV